MGLFQKTPLRQEIVLPYTISTGARKQLLIIGLGNPGKEYTNTRHNAGFIAVDSFAESNNFPAWQENKKFKALTTQATISDTSVMLIKPTTFMNLSGESARAIMDFYKIPASDILVIYDELSIPFGQIRMRSTGQSAGHNGVKSLISHIGPDFDRIRIGIKNDLSDRKDSADFVLAKFSKSELASMANLSNEVNSIITERIYGNSLPHDTRTIL